MRVGGGDHSQSDDWEPSVTHRVAGHTADNIPFLKPEAVLLCKAQARRPKDEADFAAFAHLLPAAVSAWLRLALEQAHPGHYWLARLR